MTAPRLLVALRPDETIDRAVPRRLPAVEWAYAAGGRPADWGSVEAMLIGSVERELAGVDLRSLPRLQFVQRVYTGLDGVPFDQFPPHVRFAGNVGAFAPFVAEQAMALALAAARQIPSSQAQVAAGQLRPPPVHRLLRGRTAVILGYGEIGAAIAARLAGFETRVLGLNRSGRPAPGCARMFSADQLVDAVKEGDFVFEVRPLTRLTLGTIDETVLASMKPDAVFVNVGRAATVREEALYRHLASHPEFRAAIDVWWHEDYARGRIESPFRFTDLPNFVGTPHAAGFGDGIVDHVLDRALENLARYFSGEGPSHVVDRSEYEFRPAGT